MNTATQIKNDFLLQALEVEQKLSVHRVSMIRWGKAGKAPSPIKIGGRNFWRNSEIEQLMAGEWIAES
ncbi:MAG: AlpA family phage regulatory protein [Colwellia sp.]|nr:AlpA family phage regulatory protein [Colwellia sp.]